MTPSPVELALSRAHRYYTFFRPAFQLRIRTVLVFFIPYTKCFVHLDHRRFTFFVKDAQTPQSSKNKGKGSYEPFPFWVRLF